jgi:hypothetical protein
MFGNRQFTGGLLMFFFQFLVQAGLFFTIPLYLSVALGLSAIDTGLKITPLSITLLAAAAGIPRFLPNISPRLVVQVGLLAIFAGIVSLFMNIDVHAGAEIVTVPLLLAGWGSARSPRSSAASRSPPSPTTRAQRSAGSRTRPRTWGLRSGRHSPDPC